MWANCLAMVSFFHKEGEKIMGWSVTLAVFRRRLSLGGDGSVAAWVCQSKKSCWKSNSKPYPYLPYMGAINYQNMGG